MRLLPVFLVLCAFAALLWIVSIRPDEPAPPAPVADTAAESAADATQAPAPEPAWTPPPGTIHGRVVAGESPASGLEVELLDAADAVVARQRTDASGRFAFEGIAAGDYRLKASDPRMLYTISEQPQVALAQDAVTPVELRVDRGPGAVSGTVAAGSGTPLARERIEVRGLDGPFRASVLTAGKGTFRLGGLPAGRYEVVVPRLGDSSQVVLTEEAPEAELSFAVVLPATLQVKLSGSFVHEARFTGQERLTLTPTPETAARYAGHTGRSLPEDPAERSAALAALVGELRRSVPVDAERNADFGELFPGAWKLEADFGPRSRESIGRLAEGSLHLVLQEGASYDQVVPVTGSLRGAGVRVPLGFKVGLFFFFGLLFLVPPLLFPPPLEAKAPPHPGRP